MINGTGGLSLHLFLGLTIKSNFCLYIFFICLIFAVAVYQLIMVAIIETINEIIDSIVVELILITFLCIIKLYKKAYKHSFVSLI